MYPLKNAAGLNAVPLNATELQNKTKKITQHRDKTLTVNSINTFRL